MVFHSIKLITITHSHIEYAFVGITMSERLRSSRTAVATMGWGVGHLFYTLSTCLVFKWEVKKSK